MCVWSVSDFQFLSLVSNKVRDPSCRLFRSSSEKQSFSESQKLCFCDLFKRVVGKKFMVVEF